MPNPKKKKTVLIIVLIVLAFFLFVLPQCSKAESEGVITAVPLETPNPSASWDDYLNEHPLVTTPPYEYETPEPSPTPAPPLIMATAPVSNGRFTAYRYCPEVQDGGTIDYLYQKLIPNYNLYTSLQGNHTVPYSKTNNWYNWDASTVPNGHFIVNEQCGVLNLTDTYICAYWSIYFTSSITLNAGLDYGTEVVARVKWNVDIVDNTTGLLVNSFPVLAVPYVMLDNGYYLQLDPLQSNVNIMRQGIEFKVKQNYTDRKIYRITLAVYVGCTLEMYDNTNPTTRDVAKTYTAYNNYLESPFVCSCYVDKNPSWAVGERILNFIKTLPNTIINGISSIFVPSQEDITEWVNEHVNDEMESGNPVNRYWQVYLSIMQKFVNPSYNSDPVLQVPSWSFNISGTKYTVFNGYNWRIKDADVPLGDGTTLFYWTKLAFSILLVIGVIMRFIYAIWTRIYDVHYSAENQTKDG